MKIAVIGDCMLDLEVRGEVNGDCPENREVPIVKGTHLYAYAGGAGNVANILTKAGATVDVYSNGTGWHWITEIFKKTIRCNRLLLSGYGTLPVKIRGMAGNKVLTRIDAENVNDNFQDFVALRNILDGIQQYDGIIISDYCKGLVNKNTEYYIKEIIKRSEIVVVDSKRKDYSLWRGATALTPNQYEAMSIFSTDSPSVIRSMVGVEAVYVTCSEKPLRFSFDENDVEIEIEPIENPYSIGAGDAFAAGVVFALCKKKNFLEAGITGVDFARKYVRKPRKEILK